MTKRDFILFILLTIVVVKFPPEKVEAEITPYFTFDINCEKACEQETAKVQIHADSTSEAPAGFRVSITYDPGVLTFTGAEGSRQVKSGTLRTNCGEGTVYSAYVCNTGQSDAPQLSGVALSYAFTVNSDAAQGDTLIHVTIDQVCDYDGGPLEYDRSQDLTLKIVPPLSSEAELKDLEPSIGKLKPEFSPDIYDYSITVDYNISTLTFEADSLADGTIKVSRRSLYAAGYQTPIIITVTSQNKQATAVYRVTVSRKTKPVSAYLQNPLLDKNSQPTTVHSAPDSEPDGVAPEEDEAEQNVPSRKRKKGKRTARPPNGNTADNPDFDGTDGDLQDRQTQKNTPEQGGGPRQESCVENRTLIIMQNQMPPYMTGILTTALCAVVGIALNLWLTSKPKKP